ncbi:MAG TPA: GNAT family N-acetyltransferase [Bacteroidia bacterium]|jgi:hypothetical protein|nr:GNAT family N-acetyltransferase [Bacteroidia bacterium]
MSSKEKYQQFCKTTPLALYQNDWWLNAVCGDNWDVVFTGDNSAAFAYPLKKKYNLKLIGMPMLTLGLGALPIQKTEELIEKIPAFDLFDLYFISGIKAFDLKGFKQNIRHSYHLKDISDLEKVFANFSSSTRQQIRKAEKKITVNESADIEMLYKMVSLTFKRQGKKTPYTLTYVKNINEACGKNKVRKILVAKDEEENIHGACFLAWDKQTAYYIMGGSDPKFRSSAAYSLLMWEAIKEASKHTKEFNFCGSTIPSIAKFFAGFGGEPVPYFHLKKVNSKALKLFLSLKGK